MSVPERSLVNELKDKLRLDESAIRKAISVHTYMHTCWGDGEKARASEREEKEQCVSVFV